MAKHDRAVSEVSAPTLVEAVRAGISGVVVGQEVVVERLLIALLTGGHLLLQGVPGLAKTLLVSALARAIELRFGRVQFTIDLLPADIIGSEAGTFELPEAQLDRFMMCHRLQYPPHDDEVRIIQQSVSLGLNRQGRGAVPQTAFDLIGLQPMCSIEDLVQGLSKSNKFTSAKCSRNTWWSWFDVHANTGLSS